jgi:hypothetical protein
MKQPVWLPGLVLFLGITALTVQFWYFFYKRKEGFDSNNVNLITYDILKKAGEEKEETPPTDLQAAQAYRLLLLYIKTNFAKGLLIVYDLNKRVYGKAESVPDTFDPRKVLDDFKNPILGI